MDSNAQAHNIEMNLSNCGDYSPPIERKNDSYAHDQKTLQHKLRGCGHDRFAFLSCVSGRKAWLQGQPKQGWKQMHGDRRSYEKFW
jgi:hypothetical protein